LDFDIRISNLPPIRFDIRHSTFVIGVTMTIARIFLLMAAFAVSLICAGSVRAGADDQAIIAGTRKYLAAESYTGPVKIEVEKIEGDYARVMVTPKDGQTDAALVFLKREKGVWRGLTIGTGFDPDDLAKLHIPASLRP